MVDTPSLEDDAANRAMREALGDLPSAIETLFETLPHARLERLNALRLIAHGCRQVLRQRLGFKRVAADFQNRFERAVIEYFICSELSTDEEPLRVTSWPDRDNRASKDIDAIARHYAIEHTSVDSFEGQRLDSGRFHEVFGRIEATVSLPFRLSVTARVGDVKPGMDWPLIRQLITRWIESAAGDLSEGSHDIQIEGVPFGLTAHRSSGSAEPGLFVSRADPGPVGFVAGLKAQVTRKAEKLARYQRDGWTTVLLLESTDIALMNAGKLDDGVGEAFREGLPTSVNQVWYADWSCPAVPSHHRLSPPADR
jgi:hypothetical protein